VDAESAVDGEQPGVEGNVVRGARSQAIAGIQSLAGRAVLPRFDVTREQHPLRAKRRRLQPAKDTLAAAVGQHMLSEHMLSDPGCRKKDPLCLKRGPSALVRVSGDLLPQALLEHRDIELVLTEQGKFPFMLKAKEVGEEIRSYAFRASGMEQHAVDSGEANWVIAEYGASQDVPARSMGTGTVQVGHLGQHT
jgi:hypothetical protein